MGDANNPGPAVQRRRLRTELRRARQEAALTQDEVAEAMEWSLSKIIRIEAGTVGVSANDLKALLGYYRVNDPEEVASLLALARASRERPWQSAYRDVAPQRLLQFIELEAPAFVSRNFQPLFIPGLLQTEDYARVMMGLLKADLPEEGIDSLVEVRMRRQELIDRADSPLLFFILDEAATRRLVGGPKVMREQLRRLTELAVRPRITIEVVPFSAGAHYGMQGSFVIQEFPDPGDADALYQEGPQGELLSLDDPELILHYRQVFEDLRHLSLGPEESLSFLHELVDNLS
jgi:transcriptional regulator with XRE-family HTH domain